jgi:hypothetical protein
MKKEKKESKWCARDKKLFIFIFKSQSCDTITRNTTEPYKVIGVLKPLRNYFTPCRVRYPTKSDFFIGF